MQVLFVASECAPFVKTGGLADVVGALPKALAPLGARVRVLLPRYAALAELAARGETALELGDLMGGPARVIAVAAEGLDLLLLDAPHLYERAGGPYLDERGRDWDDNGARFAALAKAGAAVAQGALGDWAPDVVSAHDWQAALVPAYLAEARARVPTVLTIHNVAFQGKFGPDVLDFIGLPRDWHHVDRGEFYGAFCFLKAGLMSCDRITTVSPTYARELMRPEFGYGLDGVMRARRADLVGIVNGIDLDVWDPETDPALPRTYSARTLRRKGANRAALMERFGLQDGTGPLFCVISRLSEQKGLDLLIAALPALMARDARLALLGSGERWMEDAFREAAARHPGRIGTVIGYDEALSHLMQGGADAILIPSRFEPCGLTQLYGLRYGTVPVVARTGGLADTVIDANPAALEAGAATGVQFSPVDAAGLEDAIARTCDLFDVQKLWEGMQKRGMRQPVGWDASARDWLGLFEALT
jgi:starch synthase